MLVGVYTGGTPNLAAVGKALGVSNETFVMVNAADVLVSAPYFLFLITIGPRVFARFLPTPEPSDFGDAEASRAVIRVRVTAADGYDLVAEPIGAAARD